MKTALCLAAGAALCAARTERPVAAPLPIPTQEIAPGVHMPLVGAGTWQYNDSVVIGSLCDSFAAGYTFVDTAWGYGNQRGVGAAIADCWEGTREELFITTKIPGGLNTTEVMQYHEQNLEWLGVDYVDLLLTHFPCDWAETPERCNKARRQEQWYAMEALVDAKTTRSIGVSHYCKSHIDDVQEIATVPIALNQVEYHIGSGDIDDVIEYCADNEIYFQSFSPLCGPCTYNASDSLVSGDQVTAIGAAHNVSGAQVSLKFVVQQAQAGKYMAGVIPKSDNPAHIAANIDLFSFNLTSDEMDQLTATTVPPAEEGDCNA